MLKLAPKLDAVRNSSVAFLCMYYYASTLKISEVALGVDIDLIARSCLIIFLLLATFYLGATFVRIHGVYRENKIRSIVALVCVAFFTAISGEPWLLIPLLLCMMFINGDIKILAGKLFVFSSVCFLSVIAAGVVLRGVGRDVVDKSYSFISFLGTEANSIGFENSNQPLLYFLLIAINGAFLYTRKSHRRVYALAMIVIATLLFAVTLSVTGYLCTLIFLLIYGFIDMKKIHIIRKATIAIVVIALTLTPYLAINYGYRDGNIVNETLSMRPYLWNLRVSDGAYFNILGSADRYTGSDSQYPTYTLDNQYLQLISRYGWIALLVVLYLFFPRSYYLENPAVMSGLFTVSIYFFSESIMYILLLSILPVASLVAVINAGQPKVEV